MVWLGTAARFLLGSRVARIALLAALVAAAVWAYGRHQYAEGARDLAEQIETARANAIQEKEAIDDAIRDLDSGDLLSRGLEWLRPSGR